MAHKYLRSGAGGGATGADWANAYLTMAAALAGMSAGDNLWVSEDHAETQASAMTNASPGTIANPCFIYCVNHAGSVPPVEADLRATATITTTGANALTNRGSALCYGIAFSAGSGASAANLFLTNSGSVGYWRYVNCAFALAGTTSTNTIIPAHSGCRCVTINCTFQFGATGHSIDNGQPGVWEWRDTASAIAGATLPSILFRPSTQGGQALLEGIDLSAIAGNIFNAGGAAAGQLWLKDCKLNASVGILNAGISSAACRVHVKNCDSGGTNYRNEEHSYMGSETTETTIVRTGGATDGTTPAARKIVTTANSKWIMPFEAMPTAIFNNVAGSQINVDIFGIWGGGAVPNADDIWIEVEYAGDASSPLGSRATSGKATNLAASVAITSDTSVWGGSATPFKMRATFTPQQKGILSVYVRAAKASSTFYFDPKPVLS